jgi:hypothetical protein
LLAGGNAKEHCWPTKLVAKEQECLLGEVDLGPPWPTEKREVVMTIFVRALDVVQPQHIEYVVPAANLVNGTEVVFDQATRMARIYTGWLRAEHGAGDDPTDQDFVSFVLFGERTQDGLWLTSPTPPQILLYPVISTELWTAAVTVSVSAFGNDPDAVSVRSATVGLEEAQFPGVAGTRMILVLRVRVAAEDGALKGVAYQATVFNGRPETMMQRRNLSPSDTVNNFHV